MKQSESLKLHNQLCFTLYSTSLAISRLYKPLLAELNLTYPQYLIMLLLWEQDGITVTHISKLLFQEKGAISPVIKRLEQQNLIERQRSHHDDRQVLIHLSTQGQLLKIQAQNIPEKVLCKIGMRLDQALELKNQLEHVRNILQDPSQ